MQGIESFATSWLKQSVEDLRHSKSAVVSFINTFIDFSKWLLAFYCILANIIGHQLWGAYFNWIIKKIETAASI